VALRIPGILSPPKGVLYSLSSFGEALLSPVINSGIVASLISTVVVVLQGFLLTNTISKNDFIQRNTLLPVFLLLLFYSHDLVFVGFHPLTIPSLILLLVLMLLLDIYNKSEAYLEIFVAALLTSLCILIYPPAWGFALFLFLALMSNSIFQWRSWVISLTGLFLPLLFLSCAYYITDAGKDTLMSFIPHYQPEAIFSIKPTILQWCSVVIISFFFIRGFWKVYAVRNEKVISFRKKMWVLIWFGVIGLLSIVYAGEAVYYHFSLLTIPAVAFVAFYLLSVKKLLWIELLMYTLIGLIIIQLYS
jgi:hypothetical protein